MDHIQIHLHIPYNHEAITYMYPIQPTTTIGDIKQFLKARNIKLEDYDARFFFGNNVEMSPVVFTTNTYDGMNFQSHANVLKDSIMHLNRKVVNVYTLMSTTDPDVSYKFIYATTDKPKLLRHFIENYLDEVIPGGNIEEFMDLYGLEGPIDYANEAHLNAIEDSIAEAYFILSEGILN